MFTEKLLFNALVEGCPFIHENRINAVLEVSMALRDSQNLSLSQIGRSLKGPSDIKHKIKKVDRLEGNKNLHEELDSLYRALSSYVFTYLSQDANLPIIIDVCFMKDDRAIQMLSAEIATKGRTLPLYRKIFKEGELKDQTQAFLKELAQCIPSDRKVIVIMDAGFHCEWFETIDSFGWFWVCRVRQGKSLKFSSAEDWLTVKDFISQVKEKTTNYERVLLTRRHEYSCRLVTTKRAPKGRHSKDSRGNTQGRIGSGRYKSAAKEPWILATNLPSGYKSTEIVNLYSKRMQIEESFRDLKSHQFGLCGRYIRTKCIHRWGVKMLLAAIVQITYWVIGVIGHSQGMQRRYQANTVRDRKVFSYFTLGKLIIEHDGLRHIKFHDEPLAQIIQNELSRDW
ncbi:MAG: IS4 family transposase [Stenotrophomonas nitritireducens]|nr:IS4 family transposase [Stenotrophomonas nitritireducens]